MSASPYYGHGGKVWLIGAGPGDPELITVKGARILGEADVIVYDRLANPALLSLTSERSEHIYVGKRAGHPSVSQNQINAILLSKAKAGCKVARLKGGDPFVFGRGGEECEALAAEGIPFEIVPGISSALAAPAFAGIPVTHRSVARSFAVVTGHTVDNEELFHNWEHLAGVDTLVILMGLGNLDRIVSTLLLHGKSPFTPVAIIEQATHEQQRVILATLATVRERAIGVRSPATIVVGKTVKAAETLAWHSSGMESDSHRQTTSEAEAYASHKPNEALSIHADRQMAAFPSSGTPLRKPFEPVTGQMASKFAG